MEMSNDERFFELVLSDLHKNFTTESPTALKATPVKWRTALLKINADNNDAIKVLKESGELDLAQADELRKKVTEPSKLVAVAP